MSVVRSVSRRLPFRRTWLFLPIDLIGLTLSSVLSFELRFDWHIPGGYVGSTIAFLILRPIVYLFIFLAFRMYTRVWRYASIKDMKAIVWSVTCASVIVKLIDLIMPNIRMPNSVWLSTYLLTLVIVGGTRLALKIYGSTNRNVLTAAEGRTRDRVLIFGAGSAGSIVQREADRDHRDGWHIIGFVDDDKHKQGLILNGIPIFGTRHDVERLIHQKNIDKILIAVPSMERSELRALVEELSAYQVPVLIIPPFTRWAVQNLFSQIRPVDVEDLLGRDLQSVDVSQIGSYICGATVLVTGAGGSIGSEICRQVAKLQPRKLVLVGRGENSIFEIQRELIQNYPDILMQFYIGDIRDYKKMSTAFAATRPDVVFHAAAHKHVPLMEEHPDEALQNNVFGTRNLAELAIAHGVAKFITISSDKAVRPTNVMGASKRVAEMVVQNSARQSDFTNFVAVRFGNVLGSRGSVVRVFREQISHGGPVTVTDERMQRYFMTIPESVRLVIEAGAVGKNGNIYLLDMGEPVRIVDLAENMIRLSGFVPGADIPIEFTGIRPGEKLFEELSRDSDSVGIDPNDRIWSVRCPMMPSAEFEQALNGLLALYDADAGPELAEAIKELAWWEPELEVGPEVVAEVAVGMEHA